MRPSEIPVARKVYGGKKGHGRYILSVRDRFVRFVEDDSERSLSISSFLAWVKEWEDQGRNPLEMPVDRGSSPPPLDRRRLGAGEREDD